MSGGTGTGTAIEEHRYVLSYLGDRNMIPDETIRAAHVILGRHKYSGSLTTMGAHVFMDYVGPEAEITPELKEELEKYYIKLTPRED